MSTTAQNSRLKDLYVNQFRAELMEELEISNINNVPKIEKITINVGIGKKQGDKRFYEHVANNLRKITGQEPVPVMAKTSIANFKIREGQSRIGVRVTLRGSIMYEFLDRLVSVVLPRVRDFQGVNRKAFDRQGNYSIGLKEQSVFPELGYEDTTTLHGLQITITTSGESKDHSKALLEKFQMPFTKEPKGANNG